jgi:hypothetical protein
MGKPQIAIRISPSLLQELNNYVELTGMSKTDVVISAIAQYLGCADNVPLNQRVGELERRLREIENLVKVRK